MEIVNSTLEDIKTIFEFYDYAIAYQKIKFNRQGFDVPLVEREIKENRQYKIVDDGKVVCIFAVTFNDPAIWGEKDKDAAIYLHRIVTHPDCRGRNYVKQIAAWAVNFCREKKMDFVRMDTRETMKN